MLDQNEKEHSATVEATQELVNGKKVLGPAGGPPTQNLTIQKPVDFTPISDLEKAKLAEAEGKHVELNDDNQIVDKRELLSAGLNLSAPNTRRLGPGSSKEKEKEADVRAHTAVGSAATLREINERRRREIERQMVEEKERTKVEHDRRERERVQRAVAAHVHQHCARVSTRSSGSHRTGTHSRSRSSSRACSARCSAS